MITINLKNKGMLTYPGIIDILKEHVSFLVTPEQAKNIVQLRYDHEIGPRYDELYKYAQGFKFVVDEQRMADGREYKLFIENRAYMTTFWFYTDDGVEPRICSSSYAFDNEDPRCVAKEFINDRWQEFKNSEAV